MVRKCSNCLFLDCCDNPSRTCKHFSPIDEEMTEVEENTLIEKRRQEFNKQWEIYIRDWD